MVQVQYRLYSSIFYEGIDIDIPQNIDMDDQSLEDHCFNHLKIAYRNKIAVFYIANKRYTKRKVNDKPTSSSS